MEAADQPTINEVLKDYGIDAYLDPTEYAELLDTLQNRDAVMRVDAEVRGAARVQVKLDKILALVDLWFPKKK